MEILITFLGLIIPFIGTTLGSSFIYIFKNKGMSVNLGKIFNGFAAGVMLAASFFGLMLPALEYQIDYMPTILVVIISFLIGVALIFCIDHFVPHFHSQENYEEGIKTQKISKDQKMFLAVLIHNVPEGLSVGVTFGVALANLTSGNDIFTVMSSALMLSIGVAIQNIPEGAIISMPLRSMGVSRKKSFLYGVLSGVVEPIGAILTLVFSKYLIGILPYLLAFAAGTMIYVVVEELIPEACDNHYSNIGTISFSIGFAIMMILDVALG